MPPPPVGCRAVRVWCAPAIVLQWGVVQCVCGVPPPLSCSGVSCSTCVVCPRHCPAVGCRAVRVWCAPAPPPRVFWSGVSCTHPWCTRTHAPLAACLFEECGLWAVWRAPPSQCFCRTLVSFHSMSFTRPQGVPESKTGMGSGRVRGLGSLDAWFGPTLAMPLGTQTGGGGCCLLPSLPPPPPHTSEWMCFCKVSLNEHIV